MKKLLITISIAFLLITSGTAFAKLTIKANHDHIKIDFFYHGSTVSVRGESDADTDIIIKIATPGSHQSLRKKGKVAGILWMNVGELKFDHVPVLYSLHSSKKISDILSQEEINKYAIGYEAVGRQAEVKPVANEADKTKWFNEFVRFKEASNLYCQLPEDVTLTASGKDQAFYVLSQWPYQAPPGDYIVTVYAVRDKKVVETAETKVFVEQVGLVKSFATMAKNSAALYGTISIAAALLAGFGVGLIFRKGGGAH
jgi:uncharacterized protein (TIGR02186 family)